MKISRRTKAIGALAGAASIALIAAGCSPAADSDSGADGPVELSLATFNDFGYSDELLQEYMDENPNVTIVQNKAATSNDARANYFQKLGKSGLADVEAVEIDWLAEGMQYSDLLAEVPTDLTSRWLDWKVEAATDADGRLIGYGTDIGPQGVCYRSDLFAAAGLPADREEVATLLDGDWDTFFGVGEQYKAATGKPFIDSANSVLQGLQNQQEVTYEDPDTGDIIAVDNEVNQENYETVVSKAIPIAAYAGQWSDDWFASMANGEFAAMLCPGWMLGVISGNAPDVAGWDFADVFPGGGANWGGSYLTVPANGANVEEAQKLADWLTAPEQQIKAFVNAGTFPSQNDAYTDTELTGFVNDYFNAAPTGEILAARAEAVTVAPFKGSKYFQVHDALQNAVTRVFDGLETPEVAWETWVAEVDAIG